MAELLIAKGAEVDAKNSVRMKRGDEEMKRY